MDEKLVFLMGGLAIGALAIWALGFFGSVSAEPGVLVVFEKTDNETILELSHSFEPAFTASLAGAATGGTSVEGCSGSVRDGRIVCRGNCACNNWAQGCGGPLPPGSQGGFHREDYCAACGGVVFPSGNTSCGATASTSSSTPATDSTR